MMVGFVGVFVKKLNPTGNRYLLMLLKVSTQDFSRIFPHLCYPL